MGESKTPVRCSSSVSGPQAAAPPAVVRYWSDTRQAVAGATLQLDHTPLPLLQSRILGAAIGQEKFFCSFQVPNMLYEVVDSWTCCSRVTAGLSRALAFGGLLGGAHSPARRFGRRTLLCSCTPTAP